MFSHKKCHSSTNEPHTGFNVCCFSHVTRISPQAWWSSCLLAAMADLAAVQTKLETLGRLAAGLEQHRVAVGVAVELLHGRLLDGRTAAGAGVAAG